MLMWFAAAVAAAGVVLLRWRREGRELYACGGNPTRRGTPASRWRAASAWPTPVSGALAGLAGLLWVGRYSIAFTELARAYELTVIAACVIGGVSIGGGVGTVGRRAAGRAVHRRHQRRAAGDPGLAVLAAGHRRRGHPVSVVLNAGADRSRAGRSWRRPPA
jgi:rhamnose transport system permease protein